MFDIEARGIVFDATRQPAEKRVAFFGSLCRLRSGTILCGFQNGPKKNSPRSTIGLCRSSDGGQTWQEQPHHLETSYRGCPGSLSAGEMIEFAPKRLLLFATWFDRTDPNRPLFDPVTEGILRAKQLLAVSADDGRTWSKWQEVPTGNLKGTALTGPPIQWKDGTIAFAFESFKEFDDPLPARHAAWVVASSDGGESFSEPLLIAQDPEHRIYYWDQRLCVGAHPGEFTALFWTHNLAEKRDLNVHLLRGQFTGQAIQAEPARSTPIPGQIAAPLELADGRLLAFVVNRGRPGTMTLWCSPDRGKTWRENARLVVHTHDERAALTQGSENVDFKQYWEDMGKWSFGHPAIVPHADHGRVLVTWYAGTPDCMSIHWARITIEARK